MALGAVALQFSFGLVFAWGAAAPSVRATDHWPEALIGAVFSATPLGYGLATVIGGRLADRIRPRRLCWTGVGLLLGGFGVAFAAPSPATFIAGYAFCALGVGGGLALTGALAAAVRAFPDHVGTMGGLLTGTYALGSAFEAPAVQVATSAFGWLDALRLVGAALAALALLAVLVMPGLPAPETVAGAAAVPRGLLKRPLILTAIAIEALLTPLGTYAFVNLGAFTRDHGMAAVVAAGALVAASAGNATGRLVGGLLTDRLGSARVLTGYVAVELGAGIAVVLGATTAGGPAVLVAGAFGCGLAFGGGAGAMSRMAAEAAPDAPNAGFGLIFSGFALGALAGPLAGSALGGGIQSWLLLSLVAGLLALLTVGVRTRLLAFRGAGPGPGPDPGRR